MQLLPCLVYPRAVAAVNHKDQALSAGEVVPPKRPNLVLPAHVPHVEFDVLVGDGLDVEADRRDRCHILVEFEFVEDGWNARDQLARGKLRSEQRNVEAAFNLTCLSRCVETQHQEALFSGTEDPAQHFGELAAHGF